MRAARSADLSLAAVLIVDGDILSRHAIAHYLRDCGYSVVEAANTDEAFVALSESTLSIDVVLCDVSVVGSRNSLELSSWVRQTWPHLEVRLAAGVDVAAQSAAELCEDGPHLKRPYEPDAVIDYIKQLRAEQSK